MCFADYGIGVLRGFVRAMCEETRGAGALGNIGHKEEIIAYLEQRGYTVEDCAAWMRDNNRRADEDEKTAPVPAEKESAADDPNDPAGALKAAIAQLSAAAAKLTERPAPAPAVDLEAVKAAAVEAARDEYRKHNPPAVVEVRNIDGAAARIERAHKATPEVLRYLAAGVNVWLAGPAGSGKTTTCEKIAAALNLNFFPVSVGGQTTKSDLLGFVDATGTYRRSVVREAFEKGGLLLIDEIDSAGANVLTILNALLANGYCSFPDGVIKKHENFRCVAAANTYGRGADRQYVGRNQIDFATLDRFAFVEFNYDEKLETALVGDDPRAVAWCEHVQSLRHAADSLKMRVVISPRASIGGARMIAAGVADFGALENALIWRGLPTEQREKIKELAAANTRARKTA